MIKNTVNVAVRIRPLLPHELENGSKTCISVVPGKPKIQVANAEKSYRFDCVSGPEADNNNFYETAIKNEVAEVFNGHDVTIVAFGQRSSGKTHTMGTNFLGEENPGIIPRSIETLFEVIGSKNYSSYQITATFVELYNKELHDLLAPNKVGEERIVEMRKNGTEFSDLTEPEVTNAEDALRFLIRGSQQRATSEKRGNSQSTRSHAVFTISVKQRNKIDPRVPTTRKLHLVDLAGSNHGKKAGKRGNINKDLLAVGGLMNQIRKGKFATYTKYRDSKLAIFLRDSLAGNSTTIFVACVSPADSSLNETLDTLRYANRLRRMKNAVEADCSRDLWNSTFIEGNSITVESNLGNSFAALKSASTSQDFEDLNESRKIDEQGIFTETIDRETEAERLQDERISCEAQNDETINVESETEDDEDSERISNILEANKTEKIEQETDEEETDEDVEEEKIQDGRESFLTVGDEETAAESNKGDLGPNNCNKIKPKASQSETDDEAEEKSLQDPPKSNKSNESLQESSEKEDEVEEKSLQDPPNSNQPNESLQEPSETDDEVEEKSLKGFQDAEKSDRSTNSSPQESSETDEDSELNRTKESQGSRKSSDSNHEATHSEPESKDSTKPERIQEPQNSNNKSFETGTKNLHEKSIEDSASKFFLKIADYFLEPSPTEQDELQSEIRSLQETLRDRTERLNKSLTDELTRQERVGLSEKRRDSAKSVVAKILDEFQEVLVKIVENSGKRDLIVRVYRRIHDQLNEQKKVAKKMLERETLEDEAMDEKYARHTMRQVERYQELQGVNRCIALLKELVVSLPVQSASVRELVGLLEETSNRIKALETEKVNLVQVLKSEKFGDEGRRSSDYEVEKVLALDESISMLWRRRIKQMICIERREKLDEQMDNMKTQIESLRNSRARLVKEMKDAEKQWKRMIASVEKKKRLGEIGTKNPTTNSMVSRKCACKVSGCLSRRCTCLKNGVSCNNCDCNPKLCRNSTKFNNVINVSVESSAPSISSHDCLKCACKTDCSSRRCACRKNGISCGDACRCKTDSCKNKKKEDSSSDESSADSPASTSSTDDKTEIGRAASSFPADLCMLCRKNGTTCANCNRSAKLPEYKTKRKARRRLFADIEQPRGNEENDEPPSKRIRLET